MTLSIPDLTLDAGEEENNPKTSGVEKLLFDTSKPAALRRQVLVSLVANDSKASQKIINKLLDGHGAQDPEAARDEKLEELNTLIQGLREGPVRSATYLQSIPTSDALGGQRVEVLLPDGSPVLTVVPDPDGVGDLETGDTVLLDGQAKAVLARQPGVRQIGEEARLVRWLGGKSIEVELDHGGKHCFYASAELVRQLESGEVEAGHSIIVCPQRHIGFRGVPQADGHSHYRYLDRGGIPHTSIARDIASPARFIGKLSDHLYREMGRAELAREYRLYRCRTVFLTGGSGTGKTINAQGFYRLMYEIMSDVTGIDMSDLPPRVLRLRCSEILSKWFGEAEKRVDAFFDEVEALSAERVVDAHGVEHELPVLVLAEEIDGMTRERGTGHDSVDDRVQTTILQRLDTTSTKLRDRLVIFICTSNVPSLLDPAFVRRAGGIIEHFGRLNRTVFEDLLSRQVRGIPFARSAGKDGRDAITGVTSSLYGQNSDRGIVEIVYAGSTQALVKYRRDFLTGAVVERAVQQAAADACQMHETGCDDPGLTSAMLLSAIADQIQSMVDQMTEHNAHHHVDVPRGSRVASVRPIRAGDPIPPELQRVP